MKIPNIFEELLKKKVVSRSQYLTLCHILKYHNIAKPTPLQTMGTIIGLCKDTTRSSIRKLKELNLVYESSPASRTQGATYKLTDWFYNFCNAMNYDPYSLSNPFEYLISRIKKQGNDIFIGEIDRGVVEIFHPNINNNNINNKYSSIIGIVSSTSVKCMATFLLLKEFESWELEKNVIDWIKKFPLATQRKWYNAYDKEFLVLKLRKFAHAMSRTNDPKLVESKFEADYKGFTKLKGNEQNTERSKALVNQVQQYFKQFKTKLPTTSEMDSVLGLTLAALIRSCGAIEGFINPHKNQQEFLYGQLQRKIARALFDQPIFDIKLEPERPKEVPKDDYEAITTSENKVILKSKHENFLDKTQIKNLLRDYLSNDEGGSGMEIGKTKKGST